MDEAGRSAGGDHEAFAARAEHAYVFLTTFMVRDRLHFSLRALPILATLVALLVGVYIESPPLTHHTAFALVSTIEAPPPADALKAGERVEPQVPSSPVGDRLSPSPPAADIDTLFASAPISALHATTLDTRRDGWRVSLIKAVPRMERGDPPRHEGLRPSCLLPVLS